MRLLLDTHILIWSMTESKKLSRETRSLLEDSKNDLFFSVLSLWEIAIKKSLKRKDFEVDPEALRSTLMGNGFEELSLAPQHVFALHQLPALHGDPFDRMLLCQARVEALTFLTNDRLLRNYPGSILLH